MVKSFASHLAKAVDRADDEGIRQSSAPTSVMVLGNVLYMRVMMSDDDEALPAVKKKKPLIYWPKAQQRLRLRFGSNWRNNLPPVEES